MDKRSRKRLLSVVRLNLIYFTSNYNARAPMYQSRKERDNCKPVSILNNQRFRKRPVSWWRW